MHPREQKVYGFEARPGPARLALLSGSGCGRPALLGAQAGSSLPPGAEARARAWARARLEHCLCTQPPHPSMSPASESRVATAAPSPLPLPSSSSLPPTAAPPGPSEHFSRCRRPGCPGTDHGSSGTRTAQKLDEKFQGNGSRAPDPSTLPPRAPAPACGSPPRPPSAAGRGGVWALGQGAAVSVCLSVSAAGPDAGSRGGGLTLRSGGHPKNRSPLAPVPLVSRSSARLQTRSLSSFTSLGALVTLSSLPVSRIRSDFGGSKRAISQTVGPDLVGNGKQK